MLQDIILQADNLKKYFSVEGGFFKKEIGQVKAVDGVSFQIAKGETLGLVGESGCGKSTLGRLILRLIEPTVGKVYFQNEDIFALNEASLKSLRKEIQIIFQDPYNSLNPKMRIGQIISEPLIVHNLMRKRDAISKVKGLLSSVGLDPKDFNRYPHQFSGGQRQRIGIARALATEPKLIVCDEPVSSLDLSIQAQVLNLLIELQEKNKFAYLFIAHNLRVVERISDRVMVMYLGKVVEIADNRSLYLSAFHPYTEALLGAILGWDQMPTIRKVVLKDDLPSPINLPSGCRFHTRCLYAKDICKEVEPGLIEKEPGHLVACHFPLASR